MYPAEIVSEHLAGRFFAFRKQVLGRTSVTMLGSVRFFTECYRAAGFRRENCGGCILFKNLRYSRLKVNMIEAAKPAEISVLATLFGCTLFRELRSKVLLNLKAYFILLFF